jgi:myo-inositol-1(or 4)-monophosphatase
MRAFQNPGAEYPMEPMVNIALRAARSAGDLIVKASQRIDRLQINEKSQNDFVTEIDHMAEKEIIDQLRSSYPDHCFIGEESGTVKGDDNDSQWIIDPLDGTTNFIRGIPHYAVSIAFRHKGRIEHAVVYDPIKQEEFTASRGRGALLNGSRIRVSGLDQPRSALYATGIPFSGQPFENMQPYLDCMAALADQSSGIRRMGAASLDLAYVAAGVLLVKEAGGRVADFQGGDDYLNSGHIVACTPRLLKPTLKTVGKHLGHLR